jgi:signal transduction histidine kinase
MTLSRRTHRLLPGWAQTIRFRLTATYSLVLFGVSALVLASIYLVLSSTMEAAPLEPVRVERVITGSPPQKVWYADNEWHVDESASFQAADIEAVEAAVNHELLAMLRTYSILALAALLAASLATGWWLSGRVLRPVRHITAAAREISATDLSRRIDLGVPRDELRTLAETLDGMLGRLHESFTAQRQLIDDASHELRNPLAVIQANVDAVLGHDDVPPADRAKAAVVVTKATNRMLHLVEDMLSSARRRSPAFVDAPVELAAVAGAVADEHALLAERRGLRLARRGEGCPVVAGDTHALHRAADNLLSNAIRLSPPGTAVAIGVGVLDGWAWLAVRDQGPGIDADHRDQIFDRFHTGSAAGAGLGLAIVRQIAESHDGMVAVHSDGDRGSTFVVWLPERSDPGVAARSPHPPGGDPMPLDYEDGASSRRGPVPSAASRSAGL